MLESDLASTPDQVVESEQPLSKNAQKRLAKAARRADQKLERRAKEKALKKEKKRARAIEAEDDPLPRPKKQRIAPRPFDAQIVIDLGFDKLMTPKECASLCSQLGYTYSSQRRSSTPFSSLIFSSLGGQTKAHLETVGQGAYTRWKHIQWWEEDYGKIWSLSSGSDTDDKSAKSKVVYLTADSDNEISELEVGYTYVIGGIVDHNRYKNLCLDKANKQGIKTVKLPIGTYLAEMKTRKVLTVNQCYDVLLRWVETRDWGDSIRHVMPKRKLKDGQAAEGLDKDTKADDFNSEVDNASGSEFGENNDVHGEEEVEGEEEEAEEVRSLIEPTL